MNTNNQIVRLINESNMNFNFYGRVYGPGEISRYYMMALKIIYNYITIRNTTNLALFAVNLFNWKVNGLNSNNIIPVAASGFIWIRNTDLFTKSLRWFAGRFAGWNTNRSIRTAINTAKYETIINLVGNIVVVSCLSWRFSRLTWIMCMPGSAVGVITGVLGWWGLNRILASETHIIDFLTELMEGLGNDLDLTTIANLLGASLTDQNIDNLFDSRISQEPQTCPICMMDDRTEIARIKSCQHEFCNTCLREWYMQSVDVFNCPLCRATMDIPGGRKQIIQNIVTKIFG